MTKKTNRFRPSLASYRELKKQRDSFEIMWVGALEARDKWLKKYQAQELISKDLMTRRSANLLEIANLNRTAAMGFLLAIVVIMVSAYQLFQAYGV